MLLPDQAARVAAALATAERNAAEAAGLVPGVVTGAWAWLIGADSTSAALRTDAAATRRLADELRAKAARWRSSTTPVEDVEVQDFERAAGETSNEAARATAHQLEPSTAAAEVGAGMVSPSTWPTWVRTLVVTVVVVALAAAILPSVAAAIFAPRARR